MATDFFDRQDHARRQTVRLLVMFALSVAAIIVAIYFVLAVAAMQVGPELSTATYTVDNFAERTKVEKVAPKRPAPTLWNPVLFAWVALGTLLVVGLGSLYKISELSAGGEQIALMLGGRAVNPQTTDLAERRLLNIVEEMALASGIPVPPVYVLDNEESINAFAAGHQPGNAVVAVSGGALRYLTREELQGVMGHEFSHILNGDMRLNLRLIGIVYGILVLATIGYYVMRTAGFSSGNSKKEGGTAWVVLLGMALLIFGYLGVFFGKLIKSAISRQREFLADASAVQFTRYPGGIAGALKKIGGLSEGSRIRDGHAEEISHMFFGNAFAGSFFDLFATHPPLADRIRALEPDFDGEFPEVRPVAITADTVKSPSATARRTALPLPGFPPVGAAASSAVMGLDAGTMVERIGRPQAEHLDQAGQMVARMPKPLLDAAREPFLAEAVIYALLLSRDDQGTRSQQLQLLQGQITPPLYQHTQQLAVVADSLSASARLPLVDLTIPALKSSSSQQYVQFRRVVDALVNVDGKVDLFEYSLRVVLFSYLDVHFGLKKSPAVHYRTVGAVAQPAIIVLSALAHIGHKEPEEARRAFQACAKNLLGQAVEMLSLQDSYQTFDAALAELAQASPKVKQSIIIAATACVAADGKVTLEESELLRAVAAILGCPAPPMAAAIGDG